MMGNMYGGSMYMYDGDDVWWGDVWWGLCIVGVMYGGDDVWWG